MNVRRKGAAFERKIAKILSKEFGYDVKRTPQSGGMSFKGDIIAIKGIASRFSWECKNQEKLNIWKALKQSIRDAEYYKIPVVVFTKNFEENYISLRLDDFINLLKEIEDK